MCCWVELVEVESLRRQREGRVDEMSDEEKTRKTGESRVDQPLAFWFRLPSLSYGIYGCGCDINTVVARASC